MTLTGRSAIPCQQKDTWAGRATLVADWWTWHLLLSPPSCFLAHPWVYSPRDMRLWRSWWSARPSQVSHLRRSCYDPRGLFMASMAIILVADNNEVAVAQYRHGCGWWWKVSFKGFGQKGNKMARCGHPHACHNRRVSGPPADTFSCCGRVWRSPAGPARVSALPSSCLPRTQGSVLTRASIGEQLLLRYLFPPLPAAPNAMPARIGVSPFLDR